MTAISACSVIIMKIKKDVSHNELVAWVRLIRTNNLGPITFSALINVYKTPIVALESLKHMLGKEGCSRKIKEICSIGEAEREIERTYKFGARIIVACQECYPDNLRNISDFPPVITVLGDESLFKKELIAMVGGRNSSVNARNFAYRLSYELSNYGFITVSGLAYGIDSAVHSVIDKGFPTIAVMGSGIDVVYPKENTELYRSIVDRGGLVMTELPFATLPKAQFFPQRNRIISGLSVGVVVLEASKKSGSLITARYAIEQGREVFAVPGSPIDHRCSGNNGLLKNGAKLVESAHDIIETLNFNRTDTLKNSLFDSSESSYSNIRIDFSNEELECAKKEILQLLDYSVTDINELICSLDINLNIILISLIELELSGKIMRYSGNKVSLTYHDKELN